MLEFDQEHWILYCINRSSHSGCEWNGPTEGQKHVIERLSAQGVIYKSSSWTSGARRDVSFLCDIVTWPDI